VGRSREGIMKKLIIRIMFNNRGLDKNELNKDWIKYRLGIFQNYTVKSLVNQTNQDFIALLSVRKETIDYVKRKLKNAPKNIMVIDRKYKEMIKEFIEDYEYLYLLRLDSDDCFINNWIERIHNYKPKEDTEVLITQNQYDYEVATGRLASYWYKSPPSYTLIYKIEDYLKGKRYYLRNGHGGAIHLKHELIDGYNMLSCLHDRNKRRIFNLDAKEREYNLKGNLVKGRKKSRLTEITDQAERKNILRSFGI
jgi:hypothetical protein